MVVRLVLFLGIFSFSIQILASGLSQNAARLLREGRERRVGLSNFEKLDREQTVIGNFKQLINPQDTSDMRTFNQRYFYNGSLAQNADSPVIFYICGEATCGESGLSQSVAKYAQNLKAHRISLEHRYYGYSQPFRTLSVDNMKYLSVENALLDLARFQRWAQENLNLRGKWIVIGGSYPGSLSAYYRFQFPTLAAGSLASSAPVEARENFQEYDLAVTRAAGPQCTARMLDVFRTLEASFQNPVQLAHYKQIFGAEEVVDNVDFLWVVADMAAVAIQYGMRDEFCGKILGSGDPIENYADEGKYLFALMGITPLMDTPQGAMSEDPNDYIRGWGMRQWFYQSCTQYGYWQAAHSDPALRSRSELLNINYFRSVCERMFGFKTPAATEALNRKFYEPIRTLGMITNIYFTNGAVDPWSELSITKERNNSNNPALDLVTIPRASHCDDLGSESIVDAAELKEARAKALRNFVNWLKGT